MDEQIIDEQIIVRDFVTIFGMVPEPADVFDRFAAVVDEDVVQGEDAAPMDFQVAVFDQKIDPAFIEFRRVPIDFVEESIEAGLIGGVDEFVGHARDGFIVTDHETGEIIGEVFTLTFVFEEVAELFDGFFDDRRSLYDSRHCSPSVAGGCPLVYSLP